METTIVICLLLVIVLLLHDKITIPKRPKQEPLQKKVNPNLPDIMGQPKSIERHSVPNTANESQIGEVEIDPANLDIEYDENDTVGVQVPQSALDEAFSNMPDLEEEEEEWNRYGISGGDDSLAQGVTYEELSSVGVLLQKENVEQSQNETAVAIVQKLQGTELFSLLESSTADAARKIAQLLASRLPSRATAVTSNLKDISTLDDFDIREFL